MLFSFLTPLRGSWWLAAIAQSGEGIQSAAGFEAPANLQSATVELHTLQTLQIFAADFACKETKCFSVLGWRLEVFAEHAPTALIGAVSRLGQVLGPKETN